MSLDLVALVNRYTVSDIQPFLFFLSHEANYGDVTSHRSSNLLPLYPRSPQDQCHSGLQPQLACTHTSSN